jgi:hypothetical protein
MLTSTCPCTNACVPSSLQPPLQQARVGRPGRCRFLGAAGAALRPPDACCCPQPVGRRAPGGGTPAPAAQEAGHAPHHPPGLPLYCHLWAGRRRPWAGWWWTCSCPWEGHASKLPSSQCWSTSAAGMATRHHHCPCCCGARRRGQQGRRGAQAAQGGCRRQRGRGRDPQLCAGQLGPAAGLPGGCPCLTSLSPYSATLLREVYAGDVPRPSHTYTDSWPATPAYNTVRMEQPGLGLSSTTPSAQPAHLAPPPPPPGAQGGGGGPPWAAVCQRVWAGRHSHPPGPLHTRPQSSTAGGSSSSSRGSTRGSSSRGSSTRGRGCRSGSSSRNRARGGQHAWRAAALLHCVCRHQPRI